MRKRMQHPAVLLATMTTISIVIITPCLDNVNDAKPSDADKNTSEGNTRHETQNGKQVSS